MRFGWGGAAALAGAVVLMSACASAPEMPQAAALESAAMCHALFDTDAEVQQRLTRFGSDMDDLCACFVSEHDALDAEGQATMMALSAKVIEVRDANGFTTTEEAVELMEDDQTGAVYGFEWDRLKAGGEPVEEAMIRAQRDPAGCVAP